jgi:SAM-dependent methyltransferase
MVAGVGPCDAAPLAEDFFDERVAKTYEAKWPELFEPAVIEPAVRFLAELAGTGAALELGVGTGRIAIPLRRRGVRVHGIDLSPGMIAQLRANPGGEAVGVTVGDFATTTVDGRFSLAYLVRNTIMNLTTQDGQVACFQNVAAHLEPGGCFVIEVAVPGLQRLPPGETIRPFTVTPAHLGFEEYDVATQLAVSHHYWVVDGGHRAPLGAVPLRLAVRARPDGPPGRHDPPRTLERLEPRAVHQRQRQPRVGLGDATRSERCRASWIG